MAAIKRTVEKRTKSAWPILIAAIAIVVFGIVFPLYKWWGVLLTAALSTAAFLISKKLFPDRVEQIEVAPEYKTGIAELDAALEEADEHIVKLRRLNDKIPNERITAAINRMVSSGDSILQELSKNPVKARSMRRFLSYYLPTAVKLMESYAMQQDAGVSGENLNEIRERIENNSETIAKTFETSLDSLYASEAIDISADISVLNSMVNGKAELNVEDK